MMCAFIFSGESKGACDPSSENFLFSFLTISPCSEKDDSDKISYSFFLYEWFEKIFE